MKDRKSFLTALGVAGASLAMPVRADAQTSPSPGPTRSPAPSAASLAAASAMRRFDRRLNDEDIETIARGIDDDRKAAPALNSKKHPLTNADEPVTIFVV